MKKNKDFFEFKTYNYNIPHDNNLKKIKTIIIIIISLITAILIIISRNIQLNIEKSNESTSVAIMQSQIEEEQEKTKEGNTDVEQNTTKQENPKISRLPNLTDIGKENMENIYHSETKRAFLTFDDGPSNITNQILETLKNENVKATFFVLGTSVENFPETTKKIYEEGHYIGNHGYTHQYSSIYSSVQAVLDEYNRCNDAVKTAIGEPEYNSHLFRFPGGLPGGKYAELKQEAKQLLYDNNILNIDWNALTGDAESQHPEAGKLMEKLKQTSEGKNSIVILMHDAQAKKVTADMLPDIISYLREQGYEFQTFYDIIK